LEELVMFDKNALVTKRFDFALSVDRGPMTQFSAKDLAQEIFILNSMVFAKLRPFELFATIEVLSVVTDL